jgi:hypothetical protein
MQSELHLAGHDCCDFEQRFIKPIMILLSLARSLSIIADMMVS